MVTVHTENFDAARPLLDAPSQRSSLLMIEQNHFLLSLVAAILATSRKQAGILLIRKIPYAPNS